MDAEKDPTSLVTDVILAKDKLSYRRWEDFTTVTSDVRPELSTESLSLIPVGQREPYAETPILN
jgi:hypothetical protein